MILTFMYIKVISTGLNIVYTCTLELPKVYLYNGKT